jgi:methyl-accepting chemotaxis protein
VSQLLSEICAASREQSGGISQIGEAVGQMDQVTQQNAALVEEIAAAASSLKMQASELVRQMAQFTVQEESPRLELS